MNLVDTCKAGERVKGNPQAQPPCIRLLPELYAFWLQIIVEDDLVDTCKPGDRVNMIGIYKAIPPRANGTIQGTFRAVVVANAVKLLLRDASAANITADDIRWAKALSGLVCC